MSLTGIAGSPGPASHVVLPVPGEILLGAVRVVDVETDSGGDLWTRAPTTPSPARRRSRQKLIVSVGLAAAARTDEKLAEFTSLDLNSDGLLTAAEASQAKSIAGGDFRTDKAVLLPPKKSGLLAKSMIRDFREMQ